MAQHAPARHTQQIHETEIELVARMFVCVCTVKKKNLLYLRIELARPLSGLDLDNTHAATEFRNFFTELESLLSLSLTAWI